MTTPVITCPMCGTRYDTTVHAACQTCPLHGGCQMVCCPACGHTTIDPSQSRLARAAARLFSWGKTAHPGPELLPMRPAEPAFLAEVPPGSLAQVTGLGPGLPAARRAHLQAYGLAPGVWVRVIQQYPVTVVEVENLELALERELSREMPVTGAKRAD